MAVHSSVNGTTAIPWRGSRKRLSLLEKLSVCQEAWCPGAPWDREMAHSTLCGTPAGSFLLVRDSEKSPPTLLCVSAGADNEAVLDYNIKSTDTAFQLLESRLSFSNLAQLVLFYSLTRDVLVVCLSIPYWIYSVTDQNKVHLSQLEPSECFHLCGFLSHILSQKLPQILNTKPETYFREKYDLKYISKLETWLCPPLDQQTEEMTHKEPSSVLCSIQLTSTNAALCIINPLYLHEHGDDWLMHRATPVQTSTLPSRSRRERRLSTTRSWDGAGLRTKRASSLDIELSCANVKSPGLNRAKSNDLPLCPLTPSTPDIAEGVVLRSTRQIFASRTPHRDSTGNLSPSTPSTFGGLNQLEHHDVVPQSPHRVSWIEDGVWLPPARPPSLLPPPLLELDSLSISSIEEEQESPSSVPQHPCAQTLADKVIYRLSLVGQALSRLVSQKKRLILRVQELSERKCELFSETLKGFVETTLKKGAERGGAMGLDFLQEVRLSLTSLRETLLDCQEMEALLDSITDISDSEIDLVVELSLHKVALKPVSAHLYSCICASRTDDGTIMRLQNNLCVLGRKGIDELGGSAGVGVPDSAVMEKIQKGWTCLHKTYSPNKKVKILLEVCKSIYHSMRANANSDRAYGADDFLPCLTWVLLRSDVVTLQIDTDYMMELLDPTQLKGEGGYYLTTLYAALFYISSFQPRFAARDLSVKAQQSLNQWHRRRTLNSSQSHYSNRRKTIRRESCWDRGIQDSETETGGEEKSGNKSDAVNIDDSQQQTESTTKAPQSLKEVTSRGQGAEEGTKMSIPESDCKDRSENP